MTADNNSVAQLLPDLDSLRSALDGVDYLADDGTVMALFCASRLGQPVLIEGEPGVGKTEAAKALAAACRAEEERGDMHFVLERRRSTRTPKRDPQSTQRIDRSSC